MKDIIYDDIFKVVEHIDKQHPLLKLKNEYERRMVSSSKSIKEDVDKHPLPGTGNDINVKNKKNNSI